MTKHNQLIVSLIIGILAFFGLVFTGYAQKPLEKVKDIQLTPLGTNFSYQGNLRLSNGQPSTGDYQFQFALYDTATNGNQVGNTISQTITLTNGLFSTELDFGGSIFTGERRWLEIRVRRNQNQDYTILSPRQEVTLSPYALYAPNAGSVDWTGITNIPPDIADGDDVGQTTVTWTDIQNRPAGLDDGDDDTTYTVGEGLVLSGTQISADINAIATSLTNTLNFTTENKLKYFTEVFTVATSGAFDWEYFTIGSDTYLAVANRQNDSTNNIDSKIYKWNGASFVEFQTIATNGATDWEYFTIGSDTYLAVANWYNGSTHNINSKIYKWNGASFVEFQTIATNGATDWEYFTIGSDTYLAVTNWYNGSTWNINSKIYKWNGASFIEFQTIATNGATDWEYFTVGSDTYLAMANNFDGSTYNINSKIYKWNGVSFVEFQTIATNGAFDWEYFTIGSNTYLAMANHRNGLDNYNINSKIYKWNGASFVEFQTIATNGAVDWEYFTIGSDIYLAMANWYNGSTYNIDSKIYRWNGTNFVESQIVTTNGAHDWTPFTIGSDIYLAMANFRNDSSLNIDSKIYKATLENFGVMSSLWKENGSAIYYNNGNVGIGTTQPHSEFEVNGYIQLDTLTSTPPTIDCDEASEYGRMKVDYQNGLLYICVQSGWISK